jgi:predicted DNA-binding transcriptional regulator YafY
MARNEQLIRQHRILQILERYRFGRTLPEIRDEVVDELGLTSLHVRSIRRDLEALQAAGIDVLSLDSQRGRIWKVGPRFRGSHTITASATELMALSLGRELLLPLAGTPFWLGIESFWNKIREKLPPAVWELYEKYRQVLFVLGTPAKSYAGKEGILKTINRAIMQHRVVEIEYQSLGQEKPKSRRVEPYGIVYYQSSLYIVVAVQDVAEGDAPIRHLKLDRFRKATALDEWFQPRTDLNLNTHLRQGIGIFSSASAKTFKIRLSAHAARWISEDPWHPDQAIKLHKNGTATLTVNAAHHLEIIPRVLALGAEAELLSPAAARHAIAQMTEEMCQKYRVANTK